MEGMKYFYELFEALPRGGPGDSESTRKAFNSIRTLPNKPSILDIGCGPGQQTVELAKITKSKIIAIDNHQPFLDKLMKEAKNNGLINNIVVRNLSMLEMDFEDKSFDLIWSEGALYFMGFENGLRKCHQLLKNRGFLAATEIVYLVNDPPAPLVQYFDEEYPDIKPVKDKIEIIQNARYRLISNFTLPESSWLNSFYLPMEKELDRLNDKYQGNEIALGIFEEMRDEVELYKKYSGCYGYEFFVMQRIN
jgi:SAM-dependent methyltransferase